MGLSALRLHINADPSLHTKVPDADAQRSFLAELRNKYHVKSESFAMEKIPMTHNSNLDYALYVLAPTYCAAHAEMEFVAIVVSPVKSLVSLGLTGLTIEESTAHGSSSLRFPTIHGIKALEALTESMILSSNALVKLPAEQGGSAGDISKQTSRCVIKFTVIYV